LDNTYKKSQGIWPFVDENLKYTGYVGIGTKSGIPSEIYSRIKNQYKEENVYIHPTLSGPYFHSNNIFLYNEFDAIFDLDYINKNALKRLNLIFSMQVRSLPYKGFFWEPIYNDRSYDFSILTWGPIDNIAKRWDRSEKIIDYLCKKGLKGIVVTQRGSKNDLITSLTQSHIKSGKLNIFDGNMTDFEFHELV
jgi:hypothetical protein